jgi:beta-phosphoglucomutase-like phosphatase (HAD superfamily)
MNGIRFTVIFDMDGTFFQTEKILVPYDRLLSAGEGKGEKPAEESFFQKCGDSR